MTINLRIAAASLLLGAGLMAAPAGAATVELVTNGDFETGDLSGWTSSATGAGNGYSINSGSFDPIGSATPKAPISGSFDVVSSQGGAGSSGLLQTFFLPTSVTSLTLSWADRIQNFAASFSDPNQEFRVELLDGSGALISTVFSTDPGDALIDLGPNLRSFDVTAALLPYVGQEIGLRFVQQDNLFFFNVSLDDISLVAAVSVPLPGSLLLLTGAMAGLGYVARRKPV